MSGKCFGLASLVAAVLGLGSVQAQGPDYTAPGAPSSAPPASGGQAATGTPMPSQWMLYERQPGCCGPTGRNGPIGYEVFLRSGMIIPVENTGLGSTLDNGWIIEGGARTLFFNPEADQAWTFELGLGNAYDRVGDRTKSYQLFNIVSTTSPTGVANVTVTGSDLNRDYAFAAIGHEWYLWGSAEQDGCTGNWRIGMDVGGQYGSEKLDLNEIEHRTNIIEGAYVAVHSDVEVPFGQCLFQAGIRAEYGYTWSNILQTQNNANLQEITVQLSAGLRF